MNVSRIGKKKSIDSEKDPYLLKARPGDSTACAGCGAVYKSKRWSLPAKATKPVGVKSKILCPACQKIKEGFAGGYVTISGDFAKSHKDEILNLIRNKETLSMGNNPLGRVMGIKDKKDSIELTTTTDKLAQRIGRILKKTFCGELVYKWSDDTKLARVFWKRDDPGPLNKAKKK